MERCRRMYLELFVKAVMIVLGFWLPAVLLDAIRAETEEAAQSAREKFCVGCGLFVVLLVFII